MNIFENSKIRRISLITLAIMQLICFTGTSQPYTEYLFYVINLTYFFLGFFSINIISALKNIAFATIPIVLFLKLIFLIVPLINGTKTDYFTTTSIALQLWSLILIIGLPIFGLGFGIRVLVLKFKKR